MDKSRGAANRTLAIHRLEAELAVTEARRHGLDTKTCSGVIGRGRAKRFLDGNGGRPPVRPERLYKNTALRAYLPSMRALRLVGPAPALELTTAGRALANAFRQHKRSALPCIDDVSSAEKTLIRQALGLDRRASDQPPSSQRRRDTYDEVASHFVHNRTAPTILEHYAAVGPRAGEVARHLHRAFVWELVSVGLSLAFSRLVRDDNIDRTARALTAALAQRCVRPPLQAFDSAEARTCSVIVACLRAALRARPDELDLEPTPFDVAGHLIKQRDASAFLEGIARMHKAAKGERPWVRLDGVRVKTIATAKDLLLPVKPRSYRLDAFRSLTHDLGA
jgi:hypothetical protein